jgi:hypothetical protein
MVGMTTGNTGDLRRKEVMMKKKMKHGGKEEMSEMKKGKYRGGMKEEMAEMKAMKKSVKKPKKKAKK